MLRRAALMDSGYRRREAVWSCTESLGSGSSDVGGDAEIVDQPPAAAAAAVEEEMACAGRVESQTSSPEKRRRTERPLPPAMPRAAEAFMRAERRGGRLILTEVVQSEQREVLRASRADGRLHLRFAEEEAPDGSEVFHAQPAPETTTETESVASGGGVVDGGCYNGDGFGQVAAGAGRRLEIGAVMGT